MRNTQETSVSANAKKNARPVPNLTPKSPILNIYTVVSIFGFGKEERGRPRDPITHMPINNKNGHCTPVC